MYTARIVHDRDRPGECGIGGIDRAVDRAGAAGINDPAAAGGRAGDPGSARRYYAETIDEARDIGAEREQGLGALGMARAELERGNVTTARKLGRMALDLLERGGGSAEEVSAARELSGQEKEVS